MRNSGRLSPFKVCPKTGRIVGIKSPRQLSLVLLPVAGFLALIWFLIRVVPKPSRAAYPCQRVAAPLAGSFLVWLAGIAGATLGLHQAQARLRQARYAAAGLALVVGLTGIAWAVTSQGLPALALPVAYTPHPANAPIGVARGLAPGRVTWVHDPAVTDWEGSATDAQRWYQLIDQDKATEMMQWALMSYAGTTTPEAAWDAIFRHFNGGDPYQDDEKIFIKINLTTSNADACADASYNWVPSSCSTSWTSIGQSPQLMVALLDQLVNVVGVAQSDITIGDPTGLWVNELYNPVHTAFPGVVYMDARGTPALGRTKATASTVPLYWSTSEASGKSQDYLLQAVVDAKYMINFAILKSHERNGITATAKNHFGTLIGSTVMRKPTTPGYYNLHSRLPLETQAPAPTVGDRTRMAQYRPLVDLNGHTKMGGKTLLYILDAIYAGKGWAGIPSKWAMAPFNNNWPASLFLSMDQVAIDSVAFDFLIQQWPEHALGNEGVQDYLHEMALADDPPSGTVYEPEHDGIAVASQGVHEHWNNATQKQYSRNIGTEGGIDLLYVTGDPALDAAARRTDQPIAVDGAGDDAAWAAAPVQDARHLILGTISDPSDLSASFRALVDDTNLYVLAGVTDDSLVNDSTSWIDDDCVALLIDGDYSRGASYDGVNDFELGLCWNDLTITAGTNSAPVPTGADFEIAQTAGGYRLEVKLPLSELGIPSGYGRLVGLDIHVLDDDLEGASDARIAWWATEDGSAQEPGLFGAGRLEGPEKVAVVPSPQGTGVLLQWTHYAWNDVYEVHRSASPYFVPDAGTLLDTVASPESQYPDAVSGSAWYYVVRAKESGLGVASNRTGRFQFDLTVP